jgi:NAD(P)H-hydrate repair Nnr-like enzyme with NAD(P)H-hydrate epimerase domain
VFIQGYKPTVFYPSPATGSPIYKRLANQCQKADIPFLLYLPSEAQPVTDSYSLLVDSIFGTGYQPPMTSDFAAIVQTLVKSRVPAVSISIPSGINYLSKKD